jgi:hypothetical protein
MNWAIWFKKLGLGIVYALAGFAVDWLIKFITDNPPPFAQTQYVVPVVMVVLAQLKNYLAHK